MARSLVSLRTHFLRQNQLYVQPEICDHPHHNHQRVVTWICQNLHLDFSELLTSSSQSQVEEKVRGVPGSITKEIPLKILSFILFAHNREKRRGGIIIKFFSQL